MARIAPVVIITSIILAIIGTTCSQGTHKYIKLPDGSIASPSLAVCEYGVLLNNWGNNIMGPDNKVIQCSGYIELTKKQAEQYENTIQEKK